MKRKKYNKCNNTFSFIFIFIQKNTFQVVLATDEIETFCFFLYDRIEWTTGVESGGSGDTGLGGNAAVVGILYIIKIILILTGKETLIFFTWLYPKT